MKGKVVLGLNAANSNYACPICEVHSRDRWDTSINASEYNGDSVRKLSVMKTQAAIKATKKNTNSKKGCVNMPLINIEPCDCIIDELHLFLRITDKLFDSFFAKMVALDRSGQGAQDRSGFECQQCCGPSVCRSVCGSRLTPEIGLLLK